ncbi:MAG: lysophospholipid acyltransferase family protein [Gammaproteobacteria bacterium]
MRMRALRFLGRLPFSARRFLGARVGDLARLAGVRRRVAARNLSLAFPRLPPEERENILRRHFQTLGKVFLDECFFLGMPKQEIRRRLAVDNEEDLQERRPVIFCAPHFAAATIGGVRLSALLGGRILFHYKPLHNQFWNRFYARLRTQYGAVGAPAGKNAMLVCARHLKRGGALFYLPDADAGRRKNTAFAPFMGVPAATTTALSRLAEISGAEVRIFTAALVADGYRFQLSPPLEDFPGPDAVQDAVRINALIGGHVRETPAQYYWLHRRFKTRPEGGENLYA